MTAPSLWASDALYSSGSASGTASKADPGAALTGQGFIPGRAAAQHLNFTLNAHSAALIDHDLAVNNAIRGRRLELFDDFVGCKVDGATLISSVGAYTLSGVGTPAMQTQTGLTDAPGIIRISTSTAANDTALLHLGAADQLITVGNLEFVEFRYRATTTIANVAFGLGFGTVADLGFGSVSRRVAFSTSVDANLHSISEQGGTNDLSMGTVTPGTAWCTVRLYPTGLTERFGATGAAATDTVTHVSNLPTGGNSVLIGVGVQTILGGVKSIELDCLRIVSNGLNRGGYTP